MTAAKKATTRQALMTTAQTAAYLNFPEDTVKDWRRRGIGPEYIKVNGAKVRYRVEDVDAWLESQKVSAA